MKKSTWILIVVVILLGGAYWLINRKPWSTASKNADDFAVKDTAAVTRIFLANKLGEKILLERQPDNSWMVNGSVPAEVTKINLLLATLHDLQIKMPVAESMHNTAMGNLGSRGIKVEVYSGEDLVKTIYVGSETPDKTGTFMILEGEDHPYIIQIQGFIGYLTPRFIMSEIKWRSKLIFNSTASGISKVSIEYPGNPTASFMYDKSLFELKKVLTSLSGVEHKVDTQRVKMFLASFEKIYAEGYYDDSVFTLQERDSLVKLTPYCVIQFEQVNGEKKKVTLYPKPIGDKTKDRYDEKGNPLEIDPEKFYAVVNGTQQIASVQEYVFRRILVKSDFFLTSK